MASTPSSPAGESRRSMRIQNLSNNKEKTSKSNEQVLTVSAAHDADYKSLSNEGGGNVQVGDVRVMMSSEHREPAKPSTIDPSKLKANLKSATGGPDKSWECSDEVKKELNDTRWSKAAVDKLNKVRGQFFLRNVGAKRDPRPRCTQTELAILLKEVKKEVSQVRCERRCVGLDPEPLKTAMSRVTQSFNRQINGRAASKGEIYAKTIRSKPRMNADGSKIETRQSYFVSTAYAYTPRTQESIESICQNIAVLKAIVEQEAVMVLGHGSNSDSKSEGS